MGRRPSFIMKDGEKVLTKESHSSFRGKHNQVKAKILLQLYSAWQKGDKDGLCLSELTELTGTSWTTLKTSLPKWLSWHYVRRKTKEYSNRPVFAYFIDARGRRFVELRLPPGKRQQFVSEIKAARSRKRIDDD